MKKNKFLYIGVGAAVLTLPLLGSISAYSCSSNNDNSKKFKTFDIDLNALYREINTYTLNTLANRWDNEDPIIKSQIKKILTNNLPKSVKTEIVKMDNHENNSNLIIKYNFDNPKYKLNFLNSDFSPIVVHDNLIEFNHLKFYNSSNVIIDDYHLYQSFNDFASKISTTLFNDNLNNNDLLENIDTIFNQNYIQKKSQTNKINLISLTPKLNDNGVILTLDLNNDLNFVFIGNNPNIKILDHNQILINNLNFWSSPTSNLTSQQKISNKEFLSTQDYRSVGAFYSRITKTYTRDIQTEYYNPYLWKKYHDSIGFVYPGWNYNYEINNNKFFGTGENRINAMELVYNETVDNSKSNVKYSDSNWIKNEIANNSLKRHPAATTFYETDIDAISDAVEKEFIISTGVRGNEPLGLYVPAGEVIKITFDDETFALMQKNNYHGISFVINDNFWDSTKPGDSGQISDRYPFLQSKFEVDSKSKTIKIGSPFGGGLSLSINMPLLGNPILHFSKPIKFKVSGAIPCLFYQDGVTTKKDWNNQVQKSLNGELAPIIQATSSDFTLQIPSRAKNTYGGYNLSSFVYPNETFAKWNNFLYLSNYYASDDLKYKIQKLNMKFCDDIWEGAAAYGGGMNFFCIPRWGVEALFLPTDPANGFNFDNSWGMLHEVNHSFEQNSALFKKRTHPETNQTTLFDYSVIGDIGRFRSEINPSGECNYEKNKYDSWIKLANEYVNIDYLKNSEFNSQKVNEYNIYQLILSTIGSKKYVDYVRKDASNTPNTLPNWTGLTEIQELSNAFKLNFYPTMEQYGKIWWNDTWPTSYNSATPKEKQIIDSLSNYPAFDFVANLYACGSYLYDKDTNQYIYNGDVLPAFEIIPNKSKIFDLNKFVNSTNKNFKWTNLEFNPLTKQNGSLSFDKTNKQLTYTPPAEVSDPNVPDEFDITIIPDTWENKPQNYVPGYKFKIKVRQTYNGGVFENFKLINDYSNTNVNRLLDLTHEYKIKSDYLGVYTSQNTAIFDGAISPNIDKKAACSRIKFRFVVPESGKYNFYANWDDLLRVYINGNKMAQFDKFSLGEPKLILKEPLELNKEQIVDIEIDVINTGGLGDFKLSAIKDKQRFNLFDHIILPEEFAGKTFSTKEQLSFKYQPRTIDYQLFNPSIFKIFNETMETPSDINLIDIEKYSLSSKYNRVLEMNDLYEGHFELWNSDHGKGKTASTFDINFKTPTNVGSLFLGFRLDNHLNARATHITVTGTNEQGNKKVLYDGPCLNRNSEYTIVPFNNVFKATKITVDSYNENTNCYAWNSANGLIWDWLRVSTEKYEGNENQSNLFGFVNPLIKKSNNWEFKNNNIDENISNFNNAYIASYLDNETIEFTLNNATGFSLVGQQNCADTNFDVIINDDLEHVYHVNVNNFLKNNAILFKYNQTICGTIKVKIVTKSATPLFLNYIKSFGKETYLS